jgi:hypothetical protein
MIQIAVINESTVVSDADAARAVAALQVQLDRDWYPIWGSTAKLLFVPKAHFGDPVLGYWQLIILDDSDQAGALGYHELTPDGLPLGKIFAKTDLDNGLSWTVTASHELLEMMADPTINLVAEQDVGLTINFWAYEVCDACEADANGYAVDLGDGGAPVVVSDFVTREFFEQTPAGTTPAAAAFDFQSKISAPFQILPGGYLSVLQAGAGAAWTQIQADGTPGGKAAPPGSRRARRQVPDSAWRRSVLRSSR